MQVIVCEIYKYKQTLNSITMKKSRNFPAFLFLIFAGMLIVTLSTSFVSRRPAAVKLTQAAETTTNEQVVEEMVKDRVWLSIACDQLIFARSSTEDCLDETRVVDNQDLKTARGTLPDTRKKRCILR